MAVSLHLVIRDRFAHACMATVVAALMSLTDRRGRYKLTPGAFGGPMNVRSHREELCADLIRTCLLSS